ncbi:hypothetical protein [Massilia sp. TWR1-2-2]|uniref:hypothetical protein n=1 Tax=Massilia sp. TWR1-2-2 TaxID=2804584 RepID=UPI003CF667CE
MGYVIMEAKELDDVRNRLHQNQLNDQDVRLLNLLLQRAHRMAQSQVSAGRMSVDQLPVGLDLVK